MQGLAVGSGFFRGVSEGRCAGDKAGREYLGFGWQGYSAAGVEEHAHGSAAHLIERVVDGGERRVGVASGGDVVEAADGDFAGDVDTFGAQAAHRAEGHGVVAYEEGVEAGAAGEKLSGGLVSGAVGVLEGFADEIRSGGSADEFAGLAERGEPFAVAADLEVIAYDGLLTGAKISFYVSFAPTVVGQMQGQYLVGHQASSTSVIMINGDQTADTGREFKAGALAALQPAFQSGHLKLGYTADTPQFDPSKAQQETEAALTKLGDKVGGVLVANDGMAAGVVAALTAQHLAGRVLVTGQDATVAGLQRILTGTQSMTVYKSIPQEAQTAAKVAVGLLEGNPNAVSSVAKTTTGNGAGEVPSVLLTPQVITKSDVSIAVDDGATIWAALCQGIPASDCPQTS